MPFLHQGKNPSVLQDPPFSPPPPILTYLDPALCPRAATLFSLSLLTGQWGAGQAAAVWLRIEPAGVPQQETASFGATPK